MFKYYMHYVRGINIYILRSKSLMLEHEQVNPTEIEAVLQENPSVQMACVIGVPNKETTNFAKALVVLKNGKNVSEKELLKKVEEKMPFYKHLHGGLQFVESLPENRGRKLDRVAIWKKYCSTENKL